MEKCENCEKKKKTATKISGIANILSLAIVTAIGIECFLMAGYLSAYADKVLISFSKISFAAGLVLVVIGIYFMKGAVDKL